MRILRGVLAALCALILGAHCLRSGALVLLVCSICLVPVAFIPRSWARMTVRVALSLGALEWLRTLLVLRAERLAQGAPYLRMTVILVAVGVLTAFAGWWSGSSGKVLEGTQRG